MLSLVVFAATVAAVLAGGAQEVAVSQDTLGNYKLKYAVEGIARVEHRDLHGNVNGGFSYIDPHGILRKTEFTSGVHGYHAIGTDIPVPVQDTPEVALAKANHLSVLRASYLPHQIPQFHGPSETFIAPVAPLAPIARFEHVAPAHHIPALPTLSHIGISETPEVLAARAEHFAAHAAALKTLYHH